MHNHEQQGHAQKGMHAGETRPHFPKRAVVTAGMPYGNKELHFGHIGGVFVQADTYARFLRDRIGKDNVVFLSGTDCYGSPIFEHYRQLTQNNDFEGSIEEFVSKNHAIQKEILADYHISLNFFGASGIGRAAEIHRELSAEVMHKLHENGHLVKMTTYQFYDPHMNVFLNGRQVVGQCPIAGCSSEKGYADECSMGHQYRPIDLIQPKSTLSGQKPEMRDITNWYFKLDAFHPLLEAWLEEFQTRPNTRNFAVKSIQEFLEPPIIYLKRDHFELFQGVKEQLPEFELIDEEKKPSILLLFKTLEDRENATAILAENSIRFRTGKTLVPFRLTGNIEWGVPAPDIDGLDKLTIWVWPESLWAPISFTKAYLESLQQASDTWKDWWCSKEAKVYQFIGEDNVYFYGPAEMGMFMGLQGPSPLANPAEGDLQLPDLIVNNHILFLDKKASSSGKVKPPMAKDLLQYYTAEQLRSHFLGLGLGLKSVSIQPKPLNPKAQPNDSDPVLKEGNLLSNVFNRAVRSCFYSLQKYNEGKCPVGDISPEVVAQASKVILDYEKLMAKCEFHMVMDLMDVYIRNINKHWSKCSKEADAKDDNALRTQLMIDTLHMIRTATVLMHPIAPEGTEMIRSYLNVGESLWSWELIFEPLYHFMADPHSHAFKFLEARVDFFKKHPSQLSPSEEG